MKLGKQTLVVTINDVDHSAECTDVSIGQRARAGGQVTFGSASDSREWYLSLTFIQSTDATSLLTLLFEHPGAKYTAVVRPAGGTTLGVDAPSYTGEITVAYTDGIVIGGAASTDTYFTTATEFIYTDEPVKDITP